MEESKKILLVEDDLEMGQFVRDTLMEEGYDTKWVEDGIFAKEVVKEGDFDLLITDLYMSKLNGQELLDELHSMGISIPTIVVTGRPDYRQIVRFVKDGVYDYFTKPLNVEEFLTSVKSGVLLSRGKALASQLEKGEAKAPLIIGKSETMKKVRETINTVANLNSTVLILGESGTGKELVAKNIHYLSLRRGQMFIPINCGSIPEALLESELFGHEKGAFTGAVFRKLGLFEAAHKGTIFLDEIGEMSHTLQVKLLRVLEDKVIRNVGSVRDISVDVRVVAATNKDLKAEVEAKNFREDLYYRLNVVPINLPPLREREEDIPPLIDHFIEKHNLNINIKKEAIKVLQKYPWPGNVRELENILVRLSILCQEREIGVDALPQEIRYAELKNVRTPSEEYFYKKAKMEFEKQFFTTLLARVNGDVAKAASLANVSKSYIYDILKKHNIQLPIK